MSHPLNRACPRPRPRPTHFLALPIGHHRALRDAVRIFQDTLLRQSLAIFGLDASIVIHPRRLHLTLGVMTLDSTTGSKSVQSAVALLTSLKPRIDSLLAGESLRVGLESMHVMKPERSGDAHVLWMGPDLTTNDTRRLRAVCDLIHTAFKSHGFIVEQRPLKLHCTILNTSYRTSTRNKRLPFSYRAVLASSAVLSISKLHPVPQTSMEVLPVKMGVWTVDEVQVCRMGSYGPENEYVSVGSIKIK